MVFAAVKKDGAGKTPPEIKRNRKHSEDIKGTKLKIQPTSETGRFAKRFSGERPVSLGFELTFLSEFK